MLERLLTLATTGGEAILYLLIGMSLLSLAVALERLFTYRRHRLDLPAFTSSLVRRLNGGDPSGALKDAEAHRAVEAQVAAEGLRNFHRKATVAAELMDAVRLRQQLNLDRRLGILGTVGSNAPFVGLLGTVLGIIKAFHDLSTADQGSAQVVMAGIAEALVATAVGLLVAIPAVVFFNYFKLRQKRIMGNVGQVQKTVLAFLGDRAEAAPTAGGGA